MGAVYKARQPSLGRFASNARQTPDSSPGFTPTRDPQWLEWLASVPLARCMDEAATAEDSTFRTLSGQTGLMRVSDIVYVGDDEIQAE